MEENKKDILLSQLIELYKEDFREMEYDELDEEMEQVYINMEYIEKNIRVIDVNKDYRYMYLHSMIKDMAYTEYLRESFCVEDVTEDMQKGWYDFIIDKMEERFGDDEKED